MGVAVCPLLSLVTFLDHYMVFTCVNNERETRISVLQKRTRGYEYSASRQKICLDGGMVSHGSSGPETPHDAIKGSFEDVAVRHNLTTAF